MESLSPENAATMFGFGFGSIITFFFIGYSISVVTKVISKA